MRSAWYLILPLFLGCAGKNTVAGQDKTKGEQLNDSVPSWCQSTCEKIVACAGDDDCSCSGDSCNCTQTNAADCVSACKQELARFSNGTDACAAAGQRFMSCIDVLKCSQITSGSGNDCNPSAQDEAMCPDPDDEPVDGNAPPVAGTGGAYSVGGTTSTGHAGEPTYGGTGVGGATGGTGAGGFGNSGGTDAGGYASGGTGSTIAVTCQESYGTGGSAGTASTSAVTCEEGRSDCSDGHEYAWLCARGSDDKVGCACFVDGAASGGFDPQAENCPALARVNSGCGFALAN